MQRVAFSFNATESWHLKYLKSLKEFEAFDWFDKFDSVSEERAEEDAAGEGVSRRQPSIAE